MSSVSAVPESGQIPAKGRRRFTVDALFTDHRPQAVGVEDLPTAKEIRLERIEADPEQPRRTFDPDRLEELTASIRREGVLQPIAVRYDADRDVYVVVHGERRLRAARQAGLAAIPAIVREVPQDRRLVQQLMENIVRDDLNAVDRAAALRTLKTQLGDAPWEAVAEMVGIRRSRLFQLIGTEKLPDHVRDDIRGGRLSEKQSRALQGLPAGHQEALHEAIIRYEFSAEEAMRTARALKRAGLADDMQSRPRSSTLSAPSRKARQTKAMRFRERRGCLRRSKPPPPANEGRRMLWRPPPGQRRRRRLTAIVSALRSSRWPGPSPALRRTSSCLAARPTCPFPCCEGRLTSCSLPTNRDLMRCFPFQGGVG